MKIRHIAMMIAVVAFGGTALAADTATVTINATVDGTCIVNSAPTITLVLDPSLSGNVSNSGNISLWCTRNTAFTISDPGSGSSGTYATVLEGIPASPTAGKTIPVTLSYNTVGTGSGRTTPVNSSITATVLNADFINAVAGNYTKQVVMTVNP